MIVIMVFQTLTIHETVVLTTKYSLSIDLPQEVHQRMMDWGLHTFLKLGHLIRR